METTTKNFDIEKCLIAMLDKIPLDHPIFGALNPSTLTMPKDLNQVNELLGKGGKNAGNFATWEKKIKAVAKAVKNYPTGEESCWFFKPDGSTKYAVFKIGDSAGYKASKEVHTTEFKDDDVTPEPSKKLKLDKTEEEKGQGKPKPTNFRLHRVLYLLANPDDYGLLINENGMKDNGQTEDTLVRHLCNNGRSTSGELVCANPFCLVKGNQFQNRDDNGCLYGSVWTCPHNPKCRFNWRNTGLPKPCFNLTQPPEKCNHQPTCKHILRTKNK